MANHPSSQRATDRWIAVIMWTVLFAVLVYTSGYATLLGFGGSITTFFQRLATLDLTGSSQSSNGLVFSAATLLVLVVLISQILVAWRRFAALTNDLIVSYARGDASAGSPFFDLLIWNMSGKDDTDDETESELDPDEADSTSVSDVLGPLGIAWIIILLAPSVLGIITALFATSAR
jgi:hypothetical protein